jgi:hypothetical protein
MPPRLPSHYGLNGSFAYVELPRQHAIAKLRVQLTDQAHVVGAQLAEIVWAIHGLLYLQPLMPSAALMRFFA